MATPASTAAPPALLPIGQGPRVVVYHQTHHHNGEYVSMLPLITNQTGVTHVIIAAIHLNEEPGNITLNDDPPDSPKFDALWAEVKWLQAAGVQVLGMLGGAAKGTFERLDGQDLAKFESYYLPLRTLLTRHPLSGLDLDVEEPMTLPGITRLLSRLHADFPPSFTLTLAPVATALLPSAPHLSGFSYFLLEATHGHLVSWYNTQFYCGWGDARSCAWYDAIVGAGWAPGKVVVGLLTNPANGPGYVEQGVVEGVLRGLRRKYPGFGGVMGWEYFNSLPGDRAEPWEWARGMARAVRCVEAPPPEGRGRVEGAGVGLTQLPGPPHRFPARDVQTLQELGFSSQQALAALNMTDGNVEYAAGMLFQD